MAPDGWLTPTERQALDPVPKVRLPETVAVAVANWRWRLRLAPTSPGILAYARHPWVVANDRLAALGWMAAHSNEEAYVAGHEARAIEAISPQRRQELALGRRRHGPGRGGGRWRGPGCAPGVAGAG